MVDPAAAAVFQAAREDPANTVCCDSGEANPQWASISHGIYLSIGASGVHRSLGVRVSYVQSTTLDSWKPLHLRMMQLGGNRRFSEFLRQHSVPEDLPIREKYSTRAARWYREALKAEAEGRSPPEPLEEGTGHLPDRENLSATDHLLNNVFSQAPREGQMTRGGVLASPSSGSRGPPSGPTRTRSCPSSHEVLDSPPGESSCKSLGAARRHGATRRSGGGADVGSQPWAWPLFGLLASKPKWLGSDDAPPARPRGSGCCEERLRTMSTGRMEGFGPEALQCGPGWKE